MTLNWLDTARSANGVHATTGESPWQAITSVCVARFMAA
jgi:hypothetical protein